MLPSAIDRTLDTLLRHEGGFVNDPADPGGATNMGITQATLADWRGTPVSVRDVQTLTEAEARAIYRDKYIRAPGFDSLPQTLLPVLADASVHHGPRQATMFLQHVLGRLDSETLVEDGLIGPETRHRTQKVLQRTGPALSRSLIEERRRFFYRLTAQKPVLEKFLNGWLARLADLERNDRDIS